MLWLAGQISLPLHRDLDAARLRSRLRVALDAVPLSALLVGWDPLPGQWEVCAAEAALRGAELYLWHPLLSELAPGKERLYTVGMDGRAGSSRAGSAGEDFAFVCPNHPDTAGIIAGRLRAALERFPSQGLFLDKIRYPSPAVGLTASLSCFCRHCETTAQAAGLDLAAVRSRLRQVVEGRGGPAALSALGIGPADDHSDGLLWRWQRFRSRSIARLVGEASAAARDRGRRVGLDLFAPLLSRVVGQDYRELAPLADWVKPMLYCRTAAPAGLPLEMAGLSRDLGPDWQAALAASLGQPDQASQAPPVDSLSLEVAAEQARAARRLAGEVPIMAGFEVVDRPGVCRVSPAVASQYARLLRSSGASGLVLSWDILDAPPENLSAVARELGLG